MPSITSPSTDTVGVKTQQETANPGLSRGVARVLHFKVFFPHITFSFCSFVAPFKVHTRSH